MIIILIIIYINNNYNKNNDFNINNNNNSDIIIMIIVIVIFFIFNDYSNYKGYRLLLWLLDFCGLLILMVIICIRNNDDNIWYIYNIFKGNIYNENNNYWI